MTRKQQASLDNSRGHWERKYAAGPEGSLSWYQRHASRSLAYITAAAGWASPIIDIGGGASTLVDDLLERGYANVSVLDIADAGLAKARDRLGAQASRVSWIVADVRGWTPPRSYDVWHDRAVFHFLTEAEDRDAYVGALKAGTKPGASVIMATFAPDGPQQCSNLPVRRYSSEALAEVLGSSFTLTDQSSESHTTPAGAEQRFAYSVFRRNIGA